MKLLFCPLFPKLVQILLCILAVISNAYSLGQGDLNNVKCIKSEEEALLHFKHGFNISSTSNPLFSWDSETDCCNWNGVGCDTTTGHVISLNLRTTNSSNRLILIGGLSSSLLDLPFLTSLDVSGNDFRKTEVPEFLGSMHNLEYLNLSGTNVRGLVPYHLGNLSHLKSLDLSDNEFSLRVNNFDWIYGLSSLKELDLSWVQVSNGENWLHAINALPFLVELRLSGCGLYEIPSHLPYVNITSLQILDLSSNKFHDFLPGWVFEMRDLQYLNLSHNEICGQIPDRFVNLESLVILDLSYNNLSGPLPSAWGHSDHQNEVVRQSSLKELHLSDNHLYGKLGESLVLLSGLEVLDVSRNDLEGTLLDSHLDNLKSLRVLELSSNHLSLNVSKNWIPPFQLEHIGLRSVQLGPSFPNWLQSQKNFLYLDVSQDNISGSVPGWFWHLSPKLESMNLSYNSLKGCVHDLSLNFNLHTLDLSGNNFHCPLPQFPPTIRTLDLAFNSFYGPISHLCDILGVNNSLNTLVLSSNYLSGNIPDCWQRATSLMFLGFRSNSLSGQIPESFGHLESLILLALSGNNLSGWIPTSLRKCSSLSYLGLANNQLSGEIPTWIGESLQKLKMLVLSNNGFEGYIPMQLCQLKLLKILYLNGNHLSGAIPGCIFEAMATMDPIPTDIYDPYNTYRELILKKSHLACKYIEDSLDTYSMCGAYSVNDLSFSLMTGLDLSSNSLTGEIPREITRHVGLVVLNLSNNQLVGSIPSDIGNMTGLEVLDLSRNRLPCSIPISLTNLSFLSYLNVSYNNLVGKIPLESQLATYDTSSYLGNHNLCGPPLAWSCPTNESFEDQHCKHSEEHEVIGEHEGQDDSMSWLETPSFYICMVLGFITGFWAFWGPLIVSRTWRHSYFSFLDRLSDNIYVTIVLAAARLKRKFLSQ